MEKDGCLYRNYVKILEEELIPAMGCTEPIALAYAASKAREVLGELPDRVHMAVSGSIIKNVKSVIVPNTGKMKGMKAACAVGIVAGDAAKELEVISSVSDGQRKELTEYLEKCPMVVEPVDNGHVFDIIVTEYAGESYAKVRIVDTHTNIVLVEKDGKILLQKEVEAAGPVEGGADRSTMTMEGIWDFIHSLDVSDVKELLDRQVRYNTAIAREGLRGKYGANIGSLLLETGDDVATRARAMAAAGSDARMNGCELPVVINSGSGNQGITVSVPVIEYAKELGVSEEKLYRALALSNLVSVHEKYGIGTLSAFCGAVSAGAAAGAGIAYLLGADFRTVCLTVSNALASISGIVCDGAKASCAARISTAVEAGIMGYQMAKKGQNFDGGDGLVMDEIEDTIRCIGLLASIGMKGTNEEIIQLMMEN